MQILVRLYPSALTSGVGKRIRQAVEQRLGNFHHVGFRTNAPGCPARRSPGRTGGGLPRTFLARAATLARLFGGHASLRAGIAHHLNGQHVHAALEATGVDGEVGALAQGCCKVPAYPPADD